MDFPPRELFFLNSNHISPARRLQQQPQYPANRQQQQSSGSGEFQPRVEWLTNKFAWYGTAKVFDCLTLTFRTNEHGVWVAHHYRYSPTMSTFLVECDAATWHRAGLATMSDEQSRAYCERVFAPDLDGHPLLSNKSIWETQGP